MASSVAWAMYLLFRQRGLHRAAVALCVLGMVAHTGGMVLRWLESHRMGIGHVPLANFYESLVVFAWAVAGCCLWMDWHLRTREAPAFLLRGEQVLVKPNCVSASRQLSATHAGALEAVLEFIARYDPRRIILGEGSADDTLRAFRNFGYLEIAERYGAEILDLNRDRAVPVTIYDREGRPRKVPVAKTALESVRVSVALPKTHDTVIITATVKNLAVGGDPAAP